MEFDPSYKEAKIQNRNTNEHIDFINKIVHPNKLHKRRYHYQFVNQQVTRGQNIMVRFLS